MARSRNPFAFTPLPVTVLSTAIYVAIFATLVVLHHRVPSAPQSDVPKDWAGVNVTSAWQDLQRLSGQYHPYNSAANVEARAWLLERIGQILDGSGIDWTTDIAHGTNLRVSGSATGESHSAILLNDLSSNITFADDRKYVNYYEGDNLLVYIRGPEDPAGRFWETDAAPAGLVLVSAHFDSVSTGYGATDDGKGVISVLQVIAHFASESQTPKHGLVAFINNGEEDGLYGAAVYTKHPIARHTTTFVNLEGAGAGGRAALFRSTDAGVTSAYGKSKHPFGTVVSADGFKRGFVRSGTDYSIYHDILGMRGLDIAFTGPRSMYHTGFDDVRHDSRTSLWHMLSAALASTKALSDQEWQKGEEDSGVWFDMLGQVFAVMQLRTVFALDVTLLVVGPVILIVLEILLKRQDRWYPFSFKTYLHGQDDDEPVSLSGIRGFFRVPIVFVVSSAAVVALAYLVTKINPFIIYSSPYVTWAMMISAHVFICWFFLSMGDALRPSALTRFYTILWLYIISWVVLVGATVLADRFDIASSYFLSFYNLTILVSLLISYFDFFALPKKSQYASHIILGTSHDAPARPSSSRQPNTSSDEPTERTSLLSPTSDRSRPTFANYRQNSSDPLPPLPEEEAEESATPDLTVHQPYGEEQAWSGSIPVWTWIPQLLLLAPLNLIVIGQIGLFLTFALNQTPADGSDVFTIYLFIALLTILLLLPLTPFLHRMMWHIPVLLLFICVGTTVYNLLGDPFTADSRLKVFFVQRVELETGKNEVALSGRSGYIEEIIKALPSSAGKALDCGPDGAGRSWAKRGELRTCIWDGLLPNVLKGYNTTTTSSPPAPQGVHSWSNSTHDEKRDMKDWIAASTRRLNTTAPPSSDVSIHRSLITISGLNTRACRLYFSPTSQQRVTNITILNACPNLLSKSTQCPEGLQKAMPTYSLNEKANEQVRLWSRTFDAEFRVVVEWQTARGEVEAGTRDELEGKAMCVWSDANVKGTIPALDEMLQYSPVWSAITKNGDGLVEGWKPIVL